MTITVEDGTVVDDADSYVDVTFADAYFVFDSTFAATWAAYDTTTKENALKWATRITDQKVVFKGSKSTETSSLRWPRSGVYDRDGNIIDDDEMPLQLKQFVCEMTKYLAVADPTSDQGIDLTRRIDVDVISIEYQVNKGTSTVPPIFNDLLRGLGSYPSASGNNFARIVKV